MDVDDNITLILQDVEKNKSLAYEKLMPRVYKQLKHLAFRQLNNEYKEHTFSKTDLVHEAYLKLANYSEIDWQNRSHFYAIASKCMRQILVDYARKKLAEKRGGDQTNITYVDSFMRQKEQAEKLIDLDTVLNKLEKFDERLAEIVEYRYFGEMTIEDTAIALDLSPSTVKRDWTKARGWLYKELKSKY